MTFHEHIIADALLSNHSSAKMGCSSPVSTAMPLIALAKVKLTCSSRQEILIGTLKPLYVKVTNLLDGRLLMLGMSMQSWMAAALACRSAWHRLNHQHMMLPELLQRCMTTHANNAYN
jgi:hypothetical protein